MRYHFRYQVSDGPHFELEGLVRSIRSYVPAIPCSLDYVERLSSVCVLADRETRPNLPAEAMSLARLERDAEAAFAIYEPGDIGIQVHDKDQGRRVMHSVEHIQGFSHPESLQGTPISMFLPSVLPLTPLHEASLGFHRFEPVDWDSVATAPGNVIYPTRNFATLGPFNVFRSMPQLGADREAIRLRI
jgi:hypothetical protein